MFKMKTQKWSTDCSSLPLLTNMDQTMYSNYYWKLKPSAVIWVQWRMTSKYTINIQLPCFSLSVFVYSYSLSFCWKTFYCLCFCFQIIHFYLIVSFFINCLILKYINKFDFDFILWAIIILQPLWLCEDILTLSVHLLNIQISEMTDASSFQD